MIVSTISNFTTAKLTKIYNTLCLKNVCVRRGKTSKWIWFSVLAGNVLKIRTVFVIFFLPRARVLIYVFFPRRKCFSATCAHSCFVSNYIWRNRNRDTYAYRLFAVKNGPWPSSRSAIVGLIFFFFEIRRAPNHVLKTYAKPTTVVVPRARHYRRRRPRSDCIGTVIGVSCFQSIGKRKYTEYSFFQGRKSDLTLYRLEDRW